MNWQEVLDVGRADAITHRRQAVLERTNATQCSHEAQTATDRDVGALWLMRAMQQRSAAVSSDAAAQISDRIADHAESVLHSSR
ncbi:hypothetical protein [Curtobacterium sp. MCSS17_005]|uniref:hypothetical protein n=1 Tax=Curtobacterium sp. MCSS17_005 TaxID=2175641 RepID=UPI0011B7FF29|nr:hypothetical protein [Curtobacterium sp. MCSS17_005]WIB34377.1 hypothetical protein DEJ20_07890 [Curtobacterium sp. MCSS17_005]